MEYASAVTVHLLHRKCDFFKIGYEVRIIEAESPPDFGSIDCRSRCAAAVFLLYY